MEPAAPGQEAVGPTRTSMVKISLLPPQQPLIVFATNSPFQLPGDAKVEVA